MNQQTHTILVAVDFEQLRDAGHRCARGEQVRWRLAPEIEVLEPELRIADGAGYLYDEYGFLDSAVRIPGTVRTITEVSYPLVPSIGTPYLSDIDRSHSDERVIDSVDPERMYEELVHAMETGTPPSQPLPPPNRHVEYRVELEINQASADTLAAARAEAAEPAAAREADNAARQAEVNEENLARMTDPIGAALAAVATDVESRYAAAVTVTRAEDYCGVSIVPLPQNVGGLSIDMDDLDGFHQFLTDDAVVPADATIPTQAAVHWNRPASWDPADPDLIELTVGTGRWELPATEESVTLIRTLLQAAAAGRAKAVVQAPADNPFVDDPLKEDFELEGTGEQLVTILWDEDDQQYQAADPHTQLWPDPEDDGYTFTTPGAAVTGFVGAEGFDYEPWVEDKLED